MYGSVQEQPNGAPMPVIFGEIRAEFDTAEVLVPSIHN
jgi:hypothetical protein